MRSDAPLERSSPTREKGFVSLPWRMTLLVAASVFAVEFAIMLLLPFFRFSPLLETIIDASTLLLVTAPVLYAFILKPLTAEVASRREAERGLREMNAALEARVAERTRELSSALEAAGKAAEAKAQFLASMSHEIRTPLNAVIGMTQLLLDSPLSEEQREFSRMADAGAQSLLAVVNDILDFSKLEAGKVELSPTDFRLQEALEECARLAAPLAQGKGLQLIVDADPGLPPALRGDRERLRQILLNLLGNAVKFTERGEVVLRAEALALSPRGPAVRFEVRDTGIGIDAAASAKLFQAFSQANASTTRRFGGTGLGLAISRRLVELMGGRIGVDSEPGAGSVFWLELPFEAAAKPPPVETPGFASGLKVLVVDANASSRAALARRLGAWGARCAALADPERALAELRGAAAAGDPFSAALVDAGPSDEDGLSLVRALRAEPGWAGLPIAVMTSFDSTRTRARAAREGASSCLTKPLSLAALAGALAGRPPAAPEEAPELGPRALAAERGRILVVEDNAANQRLTLLQLRKLGFEADVVDDGRAALKALSSRRYAMVLMDCRMPGMDGFQTAAAIRLSEGGRERVPIVAVTADALSGDRDKCLAAGMDDYLSKPVALEALARALARWAWGKGPLSWRGEYSVEIPALDSHHKALFAVLNELQADIRMGKDAGSVGKTVESLLDYARYHFAEEEALMTQRGYPSLLPHKAEHERYLAEVVRFRERVAAGDAAVSLDVLDFLRAWIERHILTLDRDYARYFAGREALSPAVRTD